MGTTGTNIISYLTFCVPSTRIRSPSCSETVHKSEIRISHRKDLGTCRVAKIFVPDAGLERIVPEKPNTMS